MGLKASRGPTGFPSKRTYRGMTAAMVRGYGVVQGTADDQCDVGTAAARVLGVLEENVVNVGDLASVIVDGEVIAIAGGALVAGDVVKMTTSGKWIPGNAADVETGGWARTSALNDTDEFVLDVEPNQKRS
jgi:hypothetical protein